MVTMAKEPRSLRTTAHHVLVIVGLPCDNSSSVHFLGWNWTRSMNPFNPSVQRPNSLQAECVLPPHYHAQTGKTLPDPLLLHRNNSRNNDMTNGAAQAPWTAILPHRLPNTHPTAAAARAPLLSTKPRRLQQPVLRN